MYTIRFTQFLQLTKNSKNLTFFVSSECELKPWFPKQHCSWGSFQVTPRVLARVTQTTFVSFWSVRIHNTLATATDHRKIRKSLISDGWKMFSHLFVIHSTKTPMTWQCRPIGGTAIYWFDVCNKINKCICINYVSSHIINYKLVSIAFAIMIGVALQEYEEYNNLPHWIWEPLNVIINKCLKHRVVVNVWNTE